MQNVVDELDKRILHELCSGIHSYDELARTCSVTRNTVYRRISRLERIQVISRRIMAIPNFSKLGLSAILIGLDVSSGDVDMVMKAIEQRPVLFLWKTYGDHQIVVVMTCERGFEGQAISEFRRSVAKLGVNDMHVSIGYEWGKISFVPC